MPEDKNKVVDVPEFEYDDSIFEPVIDSVADKVLSDSDYTQPSPIDDDFANVENTVLDTVETIPVSNTSSVSKESVKKDEKALQRAIEAAQKEYNLELNDKYAELDDYRNRRKRIPFFTKLWNSISKIIKAPFRFIKSQILGLEVQYTEFEKQMKEIDDRIVQLKREIKEMKGREFEINERINLLGEKEFQVSPVKNNEELSETENKDTNIENNKDKPENDKVEKPISANKKFEILLKDIMPDTKTVSCESKRGEPTIINLSFKNGDVASFSYSPAKGEVKLISSGNGMDYQLSEDVLKETTNNIYLAMTQARYFAGKFTDVSEKYVEKIYEQQILPLLNRTKDSSEFKIENIPVSFKRTDNGILIECQDAITGNCVLSQEYNENTFKKENFASIINKNIKQSYINQQYISEKNKHFFDFLEDKYQFKQSNIEIDKSTTQYDGRNISFVINLNTVNKIIPVEFTIDTKSLSATYSLNKDEERKLSAEAKNKLSFLSDMISCSYKTYAQQNLAIENIMPSKSEVDGCIMTFIANAEKDQKTMGSFYGLSICVDKTGDYPKLNISFKTENGPQHINFNCYNGLVGDSQILSLLNEQDIDIIYDKIKETISFDISQFQKNEIKLQEIANERMESVQEEEFDLGISEGYNSTIDDLISDAAALGDFEPAPEREDR